MNSKNISLLQLVMIFMLSSGLLNHVTIIPILLNIAGKDGWISVCLAFACFLLWLPLLRHTIHKMNGVSFVTWVYSHLKGWAWVVLFPLLIVVYGIGATTLKETATWTQITYLPNTPSFIVILTLLFLCLTAANSGLKALALTSGILLPFVVLFGFFVMSGNMPHKDYKLLRPILFNGFRPVLRGIIFAASGLSELFLIVLLQHRISGKLNYRVLILLLLILACLTIGPFMGSIAEFGTVEAAKQRYPAFEQWRLVQVSRFIEHLDFLSIYQWLAGAFVRISLSLWLIADVLSKLMNVHKTNLLMISASAMCVFTLIPLSDSAFIYFLTTYCLPINVFVLIGVSIIVWILSWTFKKKVGARV
jgi:spore germination protein KB